jgi:DNA-nicking Smr family endonuclease
MTKKSPPPASLVPDSDLWDEIKQAFVPLKPNTSKAPHHAGIPAKPKEVRSAGPLTTARNTAEPPELTGLDRRTSQKLTRGLVTYEAKLDLHGTTSARGNRLVLVVTGKGASPYARHTLHGDSHYHVPERQGRLRRLVADWFHEPEFRYLVTGFQPAHPRHGGGGAFYVRLRRRREGR